MDITKTILRFVLQSEDYPTTEVNRSLHNKYRGYIDTKYMDCTTSVGLSARGDRRYDITYIAFVNYEQTVKQGIYPVVLYFRKIKKLIFAYGVSATNESDITWDWDKINIQPPQQLSDLFEAQGWEKYDKYFDSYAYSHYDLSGFITKYKDQDITEINTELELDSFDFQQDIHVLIEHFHIMFDNVPYRKENKMQDSNSKTNITKSNAPEQTIYFGSPGTGKSFRVKNNVLKGVSDDFIFRTTFHPDTDYASFVGCYKPIMTRAKQSGKVYTIEELAEIYKREVGPTEHLKTGHIEPRIMFGYEYCEYFGGSIADYNPNKVLELAGKELAAGCQEDRVGITYIKYGINIGLKMGPAKNKSSITYDFAPQTFTNAYVKAWLNPNENVYLVIEEINRGNCAQIFGDLFQLLDRDDNGVSEYPIKADADLTKYLQEELGTNHEGIADGKIKLPANLYILATMNTSDQSLFPMDSAFKRRWEWKYVPTSVTGDKKKTLRVESKEETVLLNREQEKKVLRLGMYEYDWSVFLEKINKCITDATHSDDKQLGFWFVKTPKDSNLINIETFVSKVIFYLWTDVFKDFGAKATNPFAFKTAEGGMVVCPFSSFFDPYTGEINLGQIHGFMYNLGIIPELEPEIQATVEKNIVEEGNPKA